MKSRTSSESAPEFYARDTAALANGLRALAATLPANCRLVEVGSYRGESACIFLESGRVAHMWCVDPWQDYADPGDEAARCGGFEEIERDFDRRMAAHAGRFTKLKMVGREAAAVLGAVDAVYIDASHIYENVRDDIRTWFPKIGPGGILAGHDWHFPGVRRAVTEAFVRPSETFEDQSWLVRL